MIGRFVAAAMASTMAITGAAGAPAPMSAFGYFVGAWDCSGSFPATGKTIASTIRFDSDLDGKALVKHHDDRPPSGYHALEVWVPQPDGRGYHASISDNFGGVRLFDSPGWSGDVLTWQSAAGISPMQRFVYRRIGPTAFQLDWQTSREGGQYKVGDTLTCHRHASR